MKQKLFKTMLLLFALVAGSSAWADTTVTMTSFTAISGNVGEDTNVTYAAYKGGGTTNPAVNTNAIRLYQNSSGNTAGYVVIGVAEGYSITSATIQSTMATTTGYLLTESDPGSTTPDKNTFAVSNYSLAANTDYTVNNISTRYITFACFGTSSSSRLYLSKISITYQAAGGGSTTYSVTYDGNGNTGGDVPTDDTEYSSGDEVTVLGNGNLVKTGCSFGCWNTKADGTGDDYDEDDTFEISANTTLYAQWIPDPYTVTFGDDSSTLTEASGGAGVELPDRDDVGSYTFAGWSTTNVTTETTDAPALVGEAGDTYYPTANITLYPVYSKTEGSGGTTNETASVTISDYATANSWGSSSSSGQKSITIDSNVTAECNSGTNSGKYYNDGWRIYQTESGQITIGTASGELTSVTFTFTVSNTGTLNYNDSPLTSGTPVDVSGTSAVFTVGNSGSATNGQVRITAISVNYTTTGAGTTYYWSSPVAAAVERPEIVVAENPFYFSTTATITCETDGATIKYSYDGETWNDYSSALTITTTTTIYAKAVKDANESSVASVTATKNLAENTITVAGGTSKTIDLGQGEDQLELTASATSGATVTFTIDNENTTLTEDDDFLLEGNTIEIYSDNLGVIVLKANAAADADYAAATEVTITVTVDNSMLPGRVGNPYTVAEAIDATPASGTSANVYIHGFVSAFYNTSIVGDGTNYRYYISDDGTTNDQLLVYKGKKNSTDNFSSADDLQIGDEVVIVGGLTTYSGTKEVAANNYIVSLVRKTDSDLAITSNATVNLTITSAQMHPTSTITYTSSSTGDVIFVSDDDDVATVDAGVITAQSEGSTTITVMQEADATYKAGEQTITVNVTDNRSAVATGIDLPAAQKTLTVGDIDNFAPTATIDAGFTGTVTYTYATSDATVVDVDEATFSAEAAGTATITITATPTGGNAANYKTASQEVEVTVKGATTLALSGSTATPTYPATATITATVADGYDGTLTVSTTNAAVATASVVGTTITITPVAVGTATITVTAPETSIFNGEVVRTIAVTVNAPTGQTEAYIAQSNFVKVTSTGDITDGEYLIVYEDGEVAFNGSLNALDDVSNTIDVEINEGVIAATNTTKAATFTIDVTAGTIQSKSGYYIGRTTNSNGLDKSADTQYTNTFEIDEDDNAIITASSGRVLQYNKTAGQTRFRYFGGTQQDIQLYKLVEAPAISATLNGSGYATFCSEYPVTFSGSEDFSAWRIESINSSNEITFAKVTGSVIGGTGLLLKGEAGATIEITSADYDGTSLGTNLLEGTLAPKYVTAGQYYGLSGENFVKVNAGTVNKGKALLPASNVTVSGVKAFTFIFDDEATGIRTVETVSAEEAAQIFNLAGQRIDNSQFTIHNSQLKRGIYIVNGKKILK